MRLVKDFVIAFLVMLATFLLVTNWCFGQCPNGQCQPKESKKTIPEIQQENLDYLNSTYEWVKHNNVQFLLYKGLKIVGQWYVPEHAYYPWDGKKNLDSCKPPIDPPGRETGHLERWQKNGISVRHDREQLSYGGKVVQPHRLHEAFEGKLEDDSGKGTLVIVAKDSRVRAQVFADWQKLPTEFTTRYNVWMAPPEHFSMQDRFNGKPRFFTEGDPTVILQDKDGVVLFRRPQCEQKYQSSDMQDLLKSDPDYNPKLDPGAPVVTKLTFSAQSIAAVSVVGLSLSFGAYRVLRKLFSKRNK